MTCENNPDKVLDGISVIDNAVYKISEDREVKTTIDLSKYFTKSKCIDNYELNKKSCCAVSQQVRHYITLVLLGVISWGLLWCAWGDGWRWDGPWFRMSCVAAVAWSSGQALHALTTLPPLLAALVTGIIARNFNILDMRDYIEIDSFLRKVYPVIILGKSSLGWDLSYMRKEWKRVLTLGTLPWTAEVVTLACCTRLLLGFPWIWGILLGSIYASMSCAVVMPSVIREHMSGRARHIRNWPLLVSSAGGIDTLLSVTVYGIAFSYIFSDVHQTYKYIKIVLTLFVGLALGVGWGSMTKFLPHRDDFYVTELRVLFVLVGGLFGNFLTSMVGWGGAGGAAVLACNATAATNWEKQGWALNKNPASTAYRVIWSTLEPMLFAYAGTFFTVDKSTGNTLLVGLGILVICLTVRLSVTSLVCWDFHFSEKLYIYCTWMPKSIVEAVLCPTAVGALLSRREDPQMEYAENMITLIVQAILITTPISFLLTDRLGRKLLEKHSKKDAQSDPAVNRRTSGQYSESQIEENTTS